jgi:uncharacterized membrane protein YeaQ/YmgE (transglycosylase-associated protein family)
MNVQISDIISWLVIGMLAGSLAGMLVRRSKTGFGSVTNLAVGLVGALFGGIVVRLLKLDFGVGRIVLRWEDLVAAFIGSLLFSVILAISGRKVS